VRKISQIGKATFEESTSDRLFQNLGLLGGSVEAGSGFIQILLY